VSDGDELPSQYFYRSAQNNYAQFNTIHHLDQVWLYYSFQWTLSGRWHSSFVLNDIAMETKNSLTFNQIRFTLFDKKKVIPEAGWHCSYCSSTADIVRKLKSFSHTEYNSEWFTNESRINQSISNGLDLFGRKDYIYKLSRYNGSDGYPDVGYVKNMDFTFLHN